MRTILALVTAVMVVLFVTAGCLRGTEWEYIEVESGSSGVPLMVSTPEKWVYGDHNTVYYASNGIKQLGMFLYRGDKLVLWKAPFEAGKPIQVYLDPNDKDSIGTEKEAYRLRIYDYDKYSWSSPDPKTYSDSNLFSLRWEPIRLLSPNGGETFYRGNNGMPFMSIIWKTVLVPPYASINILYKRYNADGEYTDFIASGLTSITSVFYWAVPENLEPGRYKIAVSLGSISPGEAPNPYDDSDATFEIR